ncbi:MAG: superoxide dismutase [Desulfobacteraceae bacterium]|nr:superoxide dismutase [Desulfobacteraceae bacterium]MDH3573557.1 superoxide dismutase [Desulfobacteraceae bacterium]MDH3721787.1 superoxide dismutase [Desulfobacteraceae bacterium]MDH3838405.1 superoxide dismutase [Desulfobacteraceae bacterium]MDH3875432.1 superoxide dismutase [Desulfobacteraceae bacterium]
MKKHWIKRVHHLPKGFCLLGVIGLALLLIGCGKTGEKPLIEQEPLLYKMDALKPYISDRTFRVHYGKHYTGYVDKANQVLKGKGFEGKTVDEIIVHTAGKKEYTAIFNNVAQAWNHAFFWKCLKPGGGTVSDELADWIIKSFGSFDTFKEKFLEAAKSQFGSGWIWLVVDGEKLKIVTTDNADTPIAHGLKPVFTVDVWEHAYYLDYQNRRADFVKNVLNHIVDWNFVTSQLKSTEK